MSDYLEATLRLLSAVLIGCVSGLTVTCAASRAG